MMNTPDNPWYGTVQNSEIVMKRIAALLGVTILAAEAWAADWPAWRGPTGQGFCEEKNVLLTWSAKENVKWKVPLADQGNSTPIVWRDKIFLTQANTGGTVRSLLCFARQGGKQLWQVDVPYPHDERNWNPKWYANASATTDGQRVVVSFGSAGMYCYDFTGKEIWKRTDLGTWEHAFGNGASPVLYENLAILWCGPNAGKGRNFLIAVDKTTGATVWEKDEKVGSWSTPLIVNVNGRDQMILGMSADVKNAPDEKTGYLKGYDPKSGNELWHCHGLNSYVYTSALYGKGVAVGMSGYHGAALAVKLGGSGNITKDRLWHDNKKQEQRVGSGMIVGDHVYMVDENGMPRCYELMTGKEVWQVQKRPNGVTWGSMVHAEGRLYVLMRGGETLVFEASPTYKVLAQNQLTPGEQTNSSLAISDGDIFIRTFRHLWCIGAQKTNPKR
jgi:outer membrane protein assembly factor BamB